MHFTEDGQITELELRGNLLSFHQSIIASTFDSAEIIATLPESDSDDEQLRALLASPLYLQERGASAERSQVYHTERENLMSSSSQDPTTGGTGKPVAVFSSQNRLKKETAASLKGTLLNAEEEFRDEKAETGTRELQGQLVGCSQIVWNWTLLRGLTGERVQLHEELSLQEGALRDIRIEGIQEVVELKRAQELRVDEFSVQKIERKS